MGNRRLSRKRLFQVEKAGLKISTDTMATGAGISGAIVSASQHRQGQEIITEIAVDLGASAPAIIGGGGLTGAIGTATTDSQVARLTHANFGIVTEVRAICVEDCSRDVDVLLSTDANLAQDATVSTGVQSVLTAGGANKKGADGSYAFDTGAVYSIYFADGDTTGNTAAINDGKYIIYVHGFEAPADL
jgi:hypothetical protein